MAQTREGAIKVAARRVGLSPDDYLAKIANGEKRCTRCKQWMQTSAFRQDRSRWDGLAANCKACSYHRTTPGPTKQERCEQRSNGLAWCRRCEAWLPFSNVHAGLCRSHINEYARNHYANDERYRRRCRQVSHARKRDVAPVPAYAQEMLLEEFDGQCAYCLAPATTWDHIVPVSSGGETVPWNIVPACATCNSSKNNRDMFDWMMAKGLTGHDRLWERMVLEYVL